MTENSFAEAVLTRFDYLLTDYDFALSMAAKSGSMRSKAASLLAGMCSMETPATRTNGNPVWMPTNSSLESHLPRPVPTVVFFQPTMKLKPNAEGSKGLCSPNPARNRSNVANESNNPGSAELVNGTTVLKDASRFSNAATTLTAVSIMVKMVSIVGSVGA